MSKFVKKIILTKTTYETIIIDTQDRVTQNLGTPALEKIKTKSSKFT